MKSGLVSVTFRKLSAEQIIELVARAQLAGIEWGGDVHVPHGDEDRARDVARLTRDAGLAVAAYGSYYRVGHVEQVDFNTVLASAVELDAPLVRVWAGTRGSAEADDAYWQHVVNDTRRIADLAADAGVRIVYEYHAKTLTDTNESAVRLLREVNHENVASYWQPARGRSREDCIAGLEMVIPWMAGLHVFTWHRETGQRLALADGAEDWKEYLARSARADDGEMYALLEFVADDAPDSFLRDAETLRQWLDVF